MNWSTIISTLLPIVLSEVGKVLSSGSASTNPTDTQALATLLQTEVAFIKLIQEALNAAQHLGVISFGSPLTVDGIAGPKTMAAATALLTKFNISVP